MRGSTAVDLLRSTVRRYEFVAPTMLVALRCPWMSYPSYSARGACPLLYPWSVVRGPWSVVRH